MICGTQAFVRGWARLSFTGHDLKYWLQVGTGYGTKASSYTADSNL